MRENHQDADNMFVNGHESIRQVLLAHCKDGNRVKYHGAPYWVYNDNDKAYCENLSDQPVKDDIECFEGSVQTAIPDNHFFEEEHQNPDQRSQLPLGSVDLPLPRPMTPPSIPFGQVVTCAGRMVNPPEHYGFENQGPEVTMRDTPP